LIDSIAYGPVPSRRLGRSLGINNITPKTCSYSCVYCQVGQTTNMSIDRRDFYQPLELVNTVKEKVSRVQEIKERIDYCAFVPDGEPTLDINLGKEIELLHTANTKIAVITNASLIWREDVQQCLQGADWVSLKTDAVNPETWRRISRPHKKLNLDSILSGMLDFAKSFHGILTTETMLVKGLNDSEDEINRIADFLAELKPSKAYLAIPIRPPAAHIEPADEMHLTMAYQTFIKKVEGTGFLIGYEGNAFASTGNVADDLLSITAVHPMREDAVAALLEKNKAGWEIIHELTGNGRIMELHYHEYKYYARRIQAGTESHNEKETIT